MLEEAQAMLPWLLAAVIGAGGPSGTITIDSHDLTANFGHKNAWTIMSITCGGVPITRDSGGQGAVVNPRGLGWMGGAMSGESEEQVRSLTINGEPCDTVPDGPLTGDITLVKESTLATIEHVSTTRFADGLLQQTNRFNFTEDINLGAFYPLIYSFAPEFTHWLALPAQGDPFSGTFTSAGGHRIVREVPAFALYNEAAGKGAVVYLQQSPGGAVTLWDQTGYRKFWVQPTTGEIPAGSEFEGTMLLACFDAGEDWQSVAAALAADLQERYPMKQTQATANQLYDEGVPEHGFMTVQTENLRVVFEAASAWTIDEIHWKGFRVSGPTGHYGTVLIPDVEGGNWIGTGHTEGGREVVHSLTLTLDSEEREAEVAETIEGQKIELLKHSTIHKFDGEHVITITGSEIVQRARLTATADHGVRLMYLFMNCIEPATTHWLAELPDGNFEEGEFASDTHMKLSKDARWVAQWFPEQQLSVLQYLTSIPAPESSRILLWDQPRYHKFYVQHHRESLEFPQGAVIDHTLVFTVVEGETGDWSATKAAAERLKLDYPAID
jgi:hypothetical protein